MRVFQTSLNLGCHPNRAQPTLKPNIAHLPLLRSGGGPGRGTQSRKVFSCEQSVAGNERASLSLGCHLDRVQRAERSEPRLKPINLQAATTQRDKPSSFQPNDNCQNYEGNMHNTQPDAVLSSSCRLKSTRLCERRSKRCNPVIRWHCCTFGSNMTAACKSIRPSRQHLQKQSTGSNIRCRASTQGTTGSGKHQQILSLSTDWRTSMHAERCACAQ